MAERKKQSLLNGAIILVISTLVVKVIGLCFKMPLGSMLGLVGYGYFTSVYAIYTPIYSISMAGLPIAVSRMVAEDVALNHYREARMTLKTARKIFLLVGTAGTLLMVIISIPYAAFISDIRNLPAMIAVAPSIFFCCYVSAYRGYYEGLRNMIPTAISQVIEALGKLVIGLVFAKLIMSYGESAYNSAVAAGSATATVFGKEVSSLNEAFSVTYPWAAAGAILGVTLGSLLSLIYLGIRHRTKGDGITRLELVNSPKPPANHEIAKNMITIAVPILLSSLVLNATNLIDAVTIQNRLLHAIESDDQVNAFLRLRGLNDAEFINNHYVVFATKNGTVKKTCLEAYSRPRANGVIAINIAEGDEVVDVRLTNGHNELILANRNGRAVFRSSGRQSDSRLASLQSPDPTVL